MNEKDRLAFEKHMRANNPFWSPNSISNLDVWDLQTWQAALEYRDAQAAPTQSPISDVTEAVTRCVIEVEKLLCEKLSKQWRSSGMSIQTLVDELASRAEPVQPEAVPLDPDVVEFYYPDAVREALQRLIETTQVLGPHSREDAELICRWRGQFIGKNFAPDLPSDQATWCQYIAGLICTYLNDHKHEKAITGIIERRLWNLPKPTPPDVAEFEQWLCREMPAGTVISDPKWWAPKIIAALAKHGGAA